MGQPSGFRWARPRWQYQPTTTSHDPNPPITLEDGGAPPAVPDLTASWYEVGYDDAADDDGDFYSAVFAALAAAEPDVVGAVLDSEGGEDDDAGHYFQIVPFADFIGSSWGEDGEIEEPEDFAQLITTDPFIGAAFDVDEDDLEDAEAFVAGIVQSVAEADAFVASCFDADDGDLDDSREQDSACPVIVAVGVAPERPPEQYGGLRIPARRRKADDDVVAIMATFISTRKRR